MSSDVPIYGENDSTHKRRVHVVQVQLNNVLSVFGLCDSAALTWRMGLIDDDIMNNDKLPL